MSSRIAFSYFSSDSSFLPITSFLTHSFSPCQYPKLPNEPLDFICSHRSSELCIAARVAFPITHIHPWSIYYSLLPIIKSSSSLRRNKKPFQISLSTYSIFHIFLDYPSFPTYASVRNFNRYKINFHTSRSLLSPFPHLRMSFPISFVR